MDELDRENTMRHMTVRMRQLFPTQWSDKELADLVEEIFEADNRYMLQAHVLDAQGESGGAYYDDDDAFEFIVEALSAAHHLTEENEMPYAMLVDGFMEEWEIYLESNGMITWDR